LTDAQKTYAIADVTHLRQVYEFLAKKLAENNRSHWVEEELGVLTNPGTYIIEPKNAWKRVKTRTSSVKFLAVIQALAAFREEYAQTRDVPRNRVFKDDAMVELASNKPKSIEDLNRSRLLLREARRGDIADGILKAVADGIALPAEKAPKPPEGREKLQVNPAIADLLRVLLKAKTESAGVAAKLIAPASDLDALAAGMRDVAALSGWRAEVFGDDALRLCEGKIALAAVGSDVKVVPLD
jgi:ribonuclease D